MKHLFKILFTLTPLFLINAAKSDVIYNIGINPKSEAALQWNQNVYIAFSYKTSEASGVKIYADPMSGDSLAANYTVGGVIIYHGNGTGSKSFTITTGNVVVDKIRFQVYDANQNTLILEFFIPVKFYFSENAIYNIQLSPATYSAVQDSQFVNITFNYITTQAGGVRIATIPKTGLSIAQNFSYYEWLCPTGSGSGTANKFTILKDIAYVDGIEFLMRDNNKTTTLLDFVMPVKYKFSPNAISDIVISPSTATGLLLNEQVNVSFAYGKSATDTVTIFPIPYSNGTLPIHYTVSGPVIRATGSGTKNGWFTVTSGSITIDTVHLEMWDGGKGQVLFDWPVPVNLHFASSKITDIVFDPTSAAYFTTNGQVNISFGYTTSEAGGIKIITLPKSGSSFTPGSTASVSPLYPTGSGSGTSSFTITGGSAIIDSVSFQMYDATQTTLLQEFVVPVKFYFGNQASTGVKANSTEIVTKFVLSQNYPNPFNPSTTISFAIPSKAYVTLKVFDIMGREVATIVSEELSAGNYSRQWNAANMSSGIYFYRLQAGSYTETKKLVLLR
jgi:hypothetical protein